MVRKVFVHLTPSLLPEGALDGATAVVVDVLRATTTIAHAVAAGAESVFPCVELEEARAAAAALPQGSALLGGERGGRRPEGFDLGNSPQDYTAEIVTGKTVVFSTTNGTRALAACRPAARVITAAFPNLPSVVRALRETETVHIVCAGLHGSVSREDALLAGALAAGMPGSVLNDAAALVLDAWESAASRPLFETLCETEGGRRVLALGLEADLQAAARLGGLDVAPELDAETGRIR